MPPPVASHHNQAPVAPEWMCHAGAREEGLRHDGVMQHSARVVFPPSSRQCLRGFSLTPHPSIPPSSSSPSSSLLSDKGSDFYGNESGSHRVYILNEALRSSRSILPVHHRPRRSSFIYFTCFMFLYFFIFLFICPCRGLPALVLLPI